MALTPTQLLDAVVSAKGRYFGNFENRMSEYGAIKAFLDNADKLLPKSLIENTRKSPQHPVKIPMLNKYAATVLTERSCTIGGDENTSAFKAISWITKGFHVQVTEAVNAGNFVSVEDDFAQQFAMGLKAVAASLDTAALNALETSKSAVLATSQLATQAAGAYVVSKADYDAKKLYMNIPSIMRLNDLSGPYIDVANSEEMASMLEYRTRGVNNDQNLAGLLNGTLDGAGAYMSYLTNRLAPGANRAVHYLAPEGSIGIYSWNDWESQNNKMLSPADKKYTMQDPIFGITWGVHEKTVCVDKVGWGSVYTTSYQFISDFAFMSAYSSDTSSPIIKVTVPTSDNA